MFFSRKKKDETKKEKPALKGLTKKIMALFTQERIEDIFFDKLEDLLVESDFGALSAVEVVKDLRALNRRKWTEETLVQALKENLLLSIRADDIKPVPQHLSVYLMLGVNGVGKTTSIAKMAYRFREQGVHGIVFAAGDTFRAAAVEQLAIHASRLDAYLVKQEQGADPAAVIHDAIVAAKSRGSQVLFADTAGRMHNRHNLIRELEKIDRVIRHQLGSTGQYRKILVVDASTGQNALRQAEIFHEAVGIDAIVMSKFDSSAKGGLVAAIARQLDIPFAFIGRGEKMEDWEVFNPRLYLDELFAGMS